MLTSASLGLSLLLVTAVAAPSAEELYRKGEAFYRQNKLQQAHQYFRKVVQALEGRKKKLKQGSMPWNLMEFGQLNALYLMSQIAWKSKRKRRSCRLYQAILKRLARLPKGWQQWQVQEDARKRLQRAQRGFQGQCGPVPSVVTLQLVPTSAKVEQFVGGKWQPLKATPDKPGQRTILVAKAPALKLRITAKDHLPKTTTIQVARWSQQAVSVELKAKPKPRKRAVAVKRREPPTPPPVVPIYKKGWFWAVIGIGSAAAVGGIIAGVVLSNQPYTEGLRNNPGEPGFSLW